MFIAKAQALGVISLILGGKMLLDAARGQASSGATTLSNSLGGSEKVALRISFVIGLAGVFFGLRALCTSKTCMGDECCADQCMPGY